MTHTPFFNEQAVSNLRGSGIFKSNVSWEIYAEENKSLFHAQYVNL